jgi:hypothetical protein
MTVRYRGTPEQFYRVLKRVSAYKHVREVGPDFVRFDLDYHVVLHWWWDTGTVLRPSSSKNEIAGEIFTGGGFDGHR